MTKPKRSPFRSWEIAWFDTWDPEDLALIMCGLIGAWTVATAIVFSFADSRTTHNMGGWGSPTWLVWLIGLVGFIPGGILLSYGLFCLGRWLVANPPLRRKT